MIFPDHDRLVALIRDRLVASSDGTALVAVFNAVRLVLLRYVDEGCLARRRYVLTSKVAALRDREIARGPATSASCVSSSQSGRAPRPRPRR